MTTPAIEIREHRYLHDTDWPFFSVQCLAVVPLSAASKGLQGFAARLCRVFVAECWQPQKTEQARSVLTGHRASSDLTQGGGAMTPARGPAWQANGSAHVT